MSRIAENRMVVNTSIPDSAESRGHFPNSLLFSGAAENPRWRKIEISPDTCPVSPLFSGVSDRAFFEMAGTGRWSAAVSRQPVFEKILFPVDSDMVSGFTMGKDRRL